MSLETLPLPDMYPDWKVWAQALLRELRGEGEVGTDVGAISGLEEQIQDTIGVILADSSTIDFTYDDTAPSITAIVKPASLNASYITDFAEVLDDRVAALVQNGTGITWSYDDGAGTLTPTVTITQYTDELAQDAVGGILTDSASIDFTYDDGAGTITAIVKAGSVGATELAATAVTPGSYTNADITVDADGRLTAAASGSAGSSDFIGVSAKRTSDETTANYTAGVDIPWQATDVDTDTFWVVGTPARVTIPVAYDGYIVNAEAHVRVNLSTADTWKTLLLIQFDSANVAKAVAGQTTEAGLATAYLSAALIGKVVATGDYFVARLQEESDSSVTIVAGSSGLALQLFAP